MRIIVFFMFTLIILTSNSLDAIEVNILSPTPNEHLEWLPVDIKFEVTGTPAELKNLTRCYFICLRPEQSLEDICLAHLEENMDDLDWLDIGTYPVLNPSDSNADPNSCNRKIHDYSCGKRIFCYRVDDSGFSVYDADAGKGMVKFFLLIGIKRRVFISDQVQGYEKKLTHVIGSMNLKNPYQYKAASPCVETVDGKIYFCYIELFRAQRVIFADGV